MLKSNTKQMIDKCFEKSTNTKIPSWTNWNFIWFIENYEPNKIIIRIVNEFKLPKFHRKSRNAKHQKKIIIKYDDVYKLIKTLSKEMNWKVM